MLTIKNVINNKALIIMKMISILINKLHVVNKHEIFYLRNVISKLLIKNSNFFKITIIIKIAAITKTKRRYYYLMIMILISI